MDISKSSCKSGWLHRFEVVGTSEEGVLERCAICHQKKSFRLRNGTVNPTQYLSYHMRQALQKDHRLFAHEYPNRV